MEQFSEQLTIADIPEDEKEQRQLERILVLGAFAAELGME